MIERGALLNEFSLATDDRVVVAKTVKDFKVLKEKEYIMAVTMPNPIRMPDHRAEIAEIMKATYHQTDPARRKDIPSELRLTRMQLDIARFLERFPYCILGTIDLLQEAFSNAGHESAGIVIRQDSDYPNRAIGEDGKPIGAHSHSITGVADILGNTTVFHEGNSRDFAGRSYSLPKHHITVFRDILHGAGELERRAPRLTMFCV